MDEPKEAARKFDFGDVLGWMLALPAILFLLIVASACWSAFGLRNNPGGDGYGGTEEYRKSHAQYQKVVDDLNKLNQYSNK